MIFNPLFISNSNSVNNFGSSKFGNPGYLFADIINVNEKGTDHTTEELSAKFSSLLLGQAEDVSPENFQDFTQAEKVFANGYRLNKEAIDNFVENLVHNANSLEIDSFKVEVVNPEQASKQVFKILSEKLNESHPVELKIVNSTSALSVEIQNYNAILNSADQTGSLNVSLKLPHEDVEQLVKQLETFVNNIDAVSSQQIKMPFQLKVDLNEIIEKFNTGSNANKKLFASQDELIGQLEALVSKYSGDLSGLSKIDTAVLNNFAAFVNETNITEKIDGFNKKFSKVLVENVEENVYKATEQSIAPESKDQIASLVNLLTTLPETELPKLLALLSSSENGFDASVLKEIKSLFASQEPEKKFELTELVSELNTNQKNSLFKCLNRFSSNVQNEYVQVQRDVVIPNEISDAEIKTILQKNPDLLAKILPEIKNLNPQLHSETNLDSLFKSTKVFEEIKVRLSNLLNAQTIDVDKAITTEGLEALVKKVLSSKQTNEPASGAETAAKEVTQEVVQDSPKQPESLSIKVTQSLNEVRSDLLNALKGNENNFVSSLKELVVKINSQSAEVKIQILNDDQLKPLMNAAIAKLKIVEQPTEQLKDQLQKLVTLPVNIDAKKVKVNSVDQEVKVNTSVVNGQNADKAKQTVALDTEKLLKLNTNVEKAGKQFVLKIISQKEIVTDNQQQLKGLITKQPDLQVKKLNGSLSDLVRKELMVSDEVTLPNETNTETKPVSKFVMNNENTLQGFASHEKTGVLNSPKFTMNKLADEFTKPSLVAKSSLQNIITKESENISSQGSSKPIYKGQLSDTESTVKMQQPKTSAKIDNSLSDLKQPEIKLNANIKTINTEAGLEDSTKPKMNETASIPKNYPTLVKPNSGWNETIINRFEETQFKQVEAKEVIKEVNTFNSKNVFTENPPVHNEFAFANKPSLNGIKPKLEWTNPVNPDVTEVEPKPAKSENETRQIFDAPKNKSEYVPVDQRYAFTQKPNIDGNKPKLEWTNSETRNSAEINRTHVQQENETPQVVDVSQSGGKEIKHAEQKIEAESKPVVAANSQSNSSELNTNTSSHNNNNGLADGKLAADQQPKVGALNEPSFDKSLDMERQLRSNIERRVEVIKDVQLQSVNSKIESAIANRETQSLTLKLNPATLGKVEIALEVIDKAVNAHIEVDNEVVRQTVQANLEQLKQSLIQQGLQPQNINVSLSSSDDKGNRYFKNKKKSQHDREVELENSLEQDAPKKMGYNTYDFVA